MKLKMNVTRFMIVVSVLVGLVMGFQSCKGSPPGEAAQQLSTVPGDSTGSNLDSGNGGIYEGKPNYYQTLPGFTCEGQPAPAAVAIIDPDAETTTLAVNSAEQCVAPENGMSVPWQSTELVLRPKTLAIVEERILEKTDTPDLSGDQYWEAYCATPVGSREPEVNIAIQHAGFLHAHLYWPNSFQYNYFTIYTKWTFGTQVKYTSASPKITVTMDLSNKLLTFYGYRLKGEVRFYDGSQEVIVAVNCVYVQP